MNLLQARRENTAIQLDTDFKTDLPSKVQCIQLGGAQYAIPDKIFVCLENKICAFNKKGKLFLSFDTNLTENIKLMFVSGPDLMICGNHVYNHYKDLKDVGSYLCGDLIVDMVALYPNNVRGGQGGLIPRSIKIVYLSDKPNCNRPGLFRKSPPAAGTLSREANHRIGERSDGTSCSPGIFGGQSYMWIFRWPRRSV